MVVCSEPGCNNPATTDINGKPYCHYHAPLHKKTNMTAERDKVHPMLIFQRNPVTLAMIHTEGMREAHLPLGITITKPSEEHTEVEKEIDWITLVGAEPIDEIKHNKELVLAAEFVEREGEVTAKRLAKYLTMHPYSDMKTPDDDKARDLLDKLAELGIVKKKRRQGKKGANLYNYTETDKSWRKV